MNNTIGWDTETHEGKVILLSNSLGYSLYENGEPLDFMEMIEFLFEHGRQKRNYFYNINYDLESILRNINEPLGENVKRINYLKRTGHEQIFGKYTLFYADKTFFNLNIAGNSQTIGVSFYDMMRFFKGGLQKNAMQYLGVGKEKFDRSAIDVERLKTDFQYMSDFLKYCVIDATRTAQLADYAHELYAHLTDKPLMTPSSISEQHMIQYLKRENLFKNYFIPFQVCRISLSVFYGGRFEDMYKGRFDTVHNYDINSAYPHAISQLCQLTKTIDHADTFDTEDIYHFYGIYLIRLRSFNDNISPLIVRKPGGNVLNPITDTGYYHYCTYYDLLSLWENGVRFDVIDVMRFHHNGKLLFPYFPELYQKRLKLKKAGNDQQQTYKIILNSTYGKMLYLKPFCMPSTDKTTIEYNDSYFQKVLIPGKIFQPLFASYITAQTRRNLLKAYNSSNVISYATDGIYAKRSIHLPISDELGEWSYEKYDDGIFVKSGIRKIGEKVNARGYKGVHESTQFEKLLRSGIWDQTELTPMAHYRKWGRLVHTFQKVRKTLSINNDEKRLYPYVTPDDILERQISSTPLKVIEPSKPYKEDKIILQKKASILLKPK